MSTACVTTLLPTTEQLCSCLLRTIRSKITAALLGTANTEPYTALCSWKIKPISGSAPKSISKYTRQHDIAEAVSFIHSFREVTKPFPLPIFLWPYRNRRGFHTFPGQERENVTQIHSWDRSDVQNKIPVRYRLLQNHQRSSNPKRLASLCITKRTQKQCGNSILKSSTATSSGSFSSLVPHVKKKKKKKRKLSSRSVASFMPCYLNCLLRVQFFSGSACSQKAKSFPPPPTPPKEILKLFWVFPPASPSSDWIMYLQSELPCARRYLAVMRPVCHITRPCGLCHPSWISSWCCLSLLYDQGTACPKMQDHI